MANKSVLELAVGTGQWDAGLRKAKQSLDNFTQANGGLQQALQKESANMQKFVQMMGKMDSSAKTAKGQMSDYKSTIEQLTMQYNRMTEAQKQTIGQDYLNAIDSLRQKYQAVNEELQEMNRALSNTKAPDLGNAGGGGGPLGGNLSDMISVFGGNMMTKGAELASNALRELGNQIVDTAKQAMQLSAQSEGIRIAFDRLNRPDLLDQLREATHGTVSDLMLMQQAVKFDNFNLSLEQMGTFLAYAQQKAKDTGQSVDYMVDSIVTGLGRQSLMILDNLGLSAAEIKEEMKATGDMTTAVGEIIRRQMQSAGDYVETATDRANRATAEYENNLLKLGDTMRETFGVGTLDEFNMYLKNELAKSMMFTIETFNRARTALDDIYSAIESIGNNNAFARWAIKINEVIGPLGSVYGLLRNIVGLQGGSTGGSGGGGILAGMGRFSAKMNANRDRVVGGSYTVVKDASGKVTSAVHRGVDGSVVDYTPTVTTSGGGRGGRGGRGGGGSHNAVKVPVKPEYVPEPGTPDYVRGIIKDLQDQLGKTKDLGLREGILQDLAALEAEYKSMTTLPQMKEDTEKILSPLQQLNEELKTLKEQLELAPDTQAYQDGLQAIADKEKEIKDFKGIVDKPNKDAKEMNKNWQAAASAIQAVGSAMTAIEDPAAKVLGTIAQAVATMALSYSQASLATSNQGWGWIAFAATGLATMLSSIAAIKSATKGFANGGIVPGGSFSGDNLRTSDYGVNSGELILNRAQQDNIAAQLQGGGMQNLNLTATVTGEQIRLALNNTGRRTGNGEYLKFK
jgi:hypothetical protein